MKAARRPWSDRNRQQHLPDEAFRVLPTFPSRRTR